MENKLRNCKNYNIITSCEFLEDDLFSKKLIEFYKNAIMKAKDDGIDKIVKYDRVMRRYIEDYNFSKKLRSSIDVSSIIESNIDLTDAVLEYAVDFSSKYDERIEEVVVNTRWI